MAFKYYLVAALLASCCATTKMGRRSAGFRNASGTLGGDPNKSSLSDEQIAALNKAHSANEVNAILTGHIQDTPFASKPKTIEDFYKNFPENPEMGKIYPIKNAKLPCCKRGNPVSIPKCEECTPRHSLCRKSLTDSVDTLWFCYPSNVTVTHKDGFIQETLFGPRDAIRTRDIRWRDYLRVHVEGRGPGVRESALGTPNADITGFDRESSAQGMRGFVMKVLMHPSPNGQIFADADPHMRVVPTYVDATGSTQKDKDRETQWQGWAMSFYQCEWKDYLGELATNPGFANQYYNGFKVVYRNQNEG
jgi:hypothetical protein